jgi:hypothetical protein
MSLSLHTMRRLTTAIVLAGAITAFAAPHALAAVNSRFGQDADGWYLYALSHTQSQQVQTYRPLYERSSTPVPVVENSVQTYRPLYERSSTPVPAGAGSTRVRQVAAAVTTSGQSSFDWASAGIGAAGAAALVFLTLGGTAITLRRRRRFVI